MKADRVTPHLICCEATCVYEEVAKYIMNIRFAPEYIWNSIIVEKLDKLGSR